MKMTTQKSYINTGNIECCQWWLFVSMIFTLSSYDMCLPHIFRLSLALLFIRDKLCLDPLSFPWIIVAQCLMKGSVCDSNSLLAMTFCGNLGCKSHPPCCQVFSCAWWMYTDLEGSTHLCFVTAAITTCINDHMPQFFLIWVHTHALASTMH